MSGTTLSMLQALTHLISTNTLWGKHTDSPHFTAGEWQGCGACTHAQSSLSLRLFPFIHHAAAFYSIHFSCISRLFQTPQDPTLFSSICAWVSKRWGKPWVELQSINSFMDWKLCLVQQRISVPQAPSKMEMGLLTVLYSPFHLEG